MYLYNYTDDLYISMMSKQLVIPGYLISRKYSVKTFSNSHTLHIAIYIVTKLVKMFHNDYYY